MIVPRPKRARKNFRTEIHGTPQLTLAHVIVKLEHFVTAYAKPLMIAGVFVALAWFGFFSSIDAGLHLAVLIIFTALFFAALGRARRLFVSATPSEAKRRVEEASQLPHRPLDVLEDRPAANDPAQFALWWEHADRAREQVKQLRWPKWKLNFSNRDPFALRYALLLLLMVAGVSGWGLLGGNLIGAINPALAKLKLGAPTLDAWITPPEYTHLPPIMIATPAGARHDGDVIDVPEGSVITAHVVEKDGDAPVLAVNGEKVSFDTGEDRDYGISETITGGSKIAIKRGWQELGSWRIRVMKDQPPSIAMAAPPAASERKSVALSYAASDDYGVTAVNVRITPKESLPGVSNDPIEIQLDTPGAKEVKRASFEDLTSHPWAGLPVQIQLIAYDAAGHATQSESADFVLPERTFTHPIAQALIEERKKLLQSPDNEMLRNEAANIMAGVAHQPAAYNGDPVVLLALRSGAVRLVLDRGQESILPVSGILWQAAVRIEDGTVGLAEQTLRQAQKDLADALDRNASEQEIQKLIDRLHQALAQYLSELSNRMAAKPGAHDDLSQILGPQTNMLTPEDLDRMLDQMRNLSAAGSRGAARAELSKLQQMLENMRMAPPQLTEQQKEAIRIMQALKQLTKDQQGLLDKTFQAGQSPDPKEDAKLGASQSDLLKRLQELMGMMKGKPLEGLEPGAEAMKQAGSSLGQGMPREAASRQNEAVGHLEKALQSMADNLRQEMMMMPMPGEGAIGEGRDPFGRRNGDVADDGTVKLPDQMQAQKVREIMNELQRRAGDSNRPKEERDYIERLLQNF